MLPIKQKLAIFRQLSLTLQIPVLESAKSIEKKIDTVRLGHACSLQSSQDSDFRKRPKKRRLRIMSSSEEEGQAKKPCTASLEQSCIESKPSSNSLEVSCIDQSNESVDVPCIESKPCIGESTNTERTKDVVTTSMSIPTTITPESNSKSDIQDSATDANINYFLKKYNGRYKQDDIQNEIERIAENLNMIAQLHHRIKLTSNEARPELEKLKKSICVKVSSSLLFITKQFPDEDLLRELTGLTMLKVFEKFRVRPFGVQYHQHRGKFQNCKILLLNCLRQGMFPKSAVVDYLTDPGLRHFCFRLIQKYENFTMQTTAETPHRSNSSDGASKDGEKKTDDDNATLRKELTVNNSAKDKTNKDDSTATAENTSQLLQATGEGSIAPLSSKDAVNSADSEPLDPDTSSLSPSGGGDPAAEIRMNLKQGQNLNFWPLSQNLRELSLRTSESIFALTQLKKYKNFTGQTTAETPHRSNSSDGASKDGEKKTDDDDATLRKKKIGFCCKLIKKYENFTGQTTAETPHRSNSSDGASKDGKKKTDDDDDATLRKESTVNDSAKDKTNKDDSTATAENTSQLLQATGEDSIAPLSSKDAVNAADSESLDPDTGSLSPSGGGDPAAEILMNLKVKLEGQSLMSNVSSDVAKDIMDDDDDDDDDGIEIISSVVRAPPSIPDGRVELPCVLSTGDEAKIKFCECLRNICSFKLKTRLYLPLSEQFFRILTCFFVLFNDRKVDGEIRYLLVKIFFVNLRRYLKAWMFSIHSAELNVFIKETFTPFSYITVEQLEALPDKQADLKPNETKLYRKLTEFVTDNLKRTGFRPCSESQYVVKLNSKEHVEMKQVALKVLGDYIKATHYDPFAANNNRVLANKNRQETSAIREVSLFQLITSIDIVLAFCNKSMKERLIRAHDARIVQFFEVRGIKIQCEKDLKLDGSIGINAKEATMEPLAKYLATRLNPMSKEAIRRETSLNKPSTSMPELIPLHGTSSPTPAGPSPPRTSVMRSPVTSHVYSTASSKQMISSSSGTPGLVTSPSAGRSMPDLTLDSPRATAPSSSNSIASTSANTVASASSNPVSSANTANPRLMVVRPLHPAPTTSDPSSKTPQIGSIVRVPSDLLKKYQTSQLYSNIIEIRRDVTPTSNSYQFLPAQVHTSTTRNPPSYNFPHPSNTSVLDSAFSNPSNSSSNNSASALTNPSNSNLPSNYVLVSAPTNPSNSNPPSNYVLNSALPTTPSNSSSTNYVANTKDPPAYCIVGPAQSNTYSLNNTMVSQSSASQSNYSSTSTSQPPNISQSSSSYSWPRSSPNFIWLPAGGDFEPHRINQPAEPRQKGPVRRGTGKRGGGGNRGKRGRGRGGIRLVDPSRLLGVSALRTPGTPAYTGDSNPFVPTTATQALRALRPALPQQSGQNTDNQYSSRNYEDPNVNHDPRGNYQAPGGNYQAPNGSYQNPIGSYQDPSSSYQDPSSSYQDLSGNYHDPASYENFNFNSLATGMGDNGLENIRIENVLGGTCMSDQSDNAPSSELGIDTLAALESNYQPENFCAACGAQASMQCSGCYRIFYCSDSCQLNHWQIIHHEECVPSS